MPHGRQANAFTLIELLVVVSIIAMLIAVLLPVLGKARASGRQVASLSNSKQWGLGTLSAMQDQRSYFPFEGADFSSTGALTENNVRDSFDQEGWWGNLVPPYVGQPKYRDLCEQRLTAGQEVPTPGEQRSFFVDPGADKPNLSIAFPYTTSGATIVDATFSVTGTIDTSVKRQFYFNYVFNSNLDNGTDGNNGTGIGQYNGKNRVNEQQVPQASKTVIMLEIRSMQEELPEGDPWRNTSQYYLARCNGNWKRFAARYNGGGHLVFGDGHAAHYRNDYITTETDTGSGATRRTNTTGQVNWVLSKPDVIWNPVGPSYN